MQLLSRLVLGAGPMIALAAAQGSFRPADTVPWKPSKANALALAKQADAAMAKLRGIEAETLTLIRYEGSGHSAGLIQVKDNRTFAASVPWVHYPRTRKDDPIPGAQVVSDGKLVEEPAIFGRGRRVSSVESFRFASGVQVEDWVTGLPRFILGGIHRETPITDLVQQAGRPGSGYKVTVKERIFPAGKYRLPQNLIVIDRVPAAAKRLGSVHLEIAIDGFRKLPVQATSVATEKGRKPIAVSWIGQWNMRPKSFVATTFTLPSKRH